MSRDVNVACTIHPAVQSDIGEQQWVTRFHRRWQLSLSWQANTVRPSVDCRLDDTAFVAGTFSWQDPVYSWKAGPGEVMTVENLFYLLFHAQENTYVVYGYMNIAGL